MPNTKWSRVITPIVLVTFLLTGVGTLSAQGAREATVAVSNGASPSTSAPSVSSSRAGAPPVGDVLVGAAASPPMGSGDGSFLVEPTHGRVIMKVRLAGGANAFRVAISGHTAYVPTLQGKTYVVNLRSREVVSSFSTPAGARIADVANHQLIITGAKNVTAFALPSLKREWQVATGGNALAVVGHTAYLSGNGMRTTKIIDLTSGKIIGSIPVGKIEDSLYVPQRHELWLANWWNGSMTVVNTATERVVKVITRKEGSGITAKDLSSPKFMMAAPGGYMQLALGPQGRHVYAASFSGNIMVFNTRNNTFEKDIPTVPMAKLSGIAVDPSGRYAYTTVENKKETIALSLKTGKVESAYAGLASNRWFVITSGSPTTM